MKLKIMLPLPVFLMIMLSGCEYQQSDKTSQITDEQTITASDNTKSKINIASLSPSLSTNGTAYFRLKNRWTQKYMNAQYGDTRQYEYVKNENISPSWWSAEWSFEYVSNYCYRIKNRWNGQYIVSIILNDYVAFLGNDSFKTGVFYLQITNGYYQIQLASNGRSLHCENNLGHVQLGYVNSDWWSKDWIIEYAGSE